MTTRYINEGDIVSIFVSTESSIYTLVNRWENPIDPAIPREFKVTHKAAYSGDLWSVEGWIGAEGINLAVNQQSADFDAFVLRLDAQGAFDREQRIARGED